MYDDSIEKLADAMREYCWGRSCRRCFLKPLCDEYFNTAPGSEHWADVLYNLDREESDDAEE